MALDYLPSPSWAVIYGETPSADRWSELGENDDALATGAGWDDDSVKARHMDWASTGANGGIWWEELGRATAVSAVTSLAVTFPTRKHIKIIVFFEAASASSGANIYLNNDNGSGNYRRRHTYNNASSVSVLSSDTSFLAAVTTTTSGEIGILEGILTNANSTTREKIFTFVAGSITDHRTGISQWKTSGNAVTTVSLVTSPTGNMGVGSSLIVLGHN